MKIELDLPANVVRRLAKGDWEISLGWGVRTPAALYKAEVAIAAAVAEVVNGEAS